MLPYPGINHVRKSHTLFILILFIQFYVLLIDYIIKSAYELLN